MSLKEAMHYEKEGKIVKCYLCPHHCVIKPGQRGVCGVRENIDGTLYTLNYGKVSAFNLDPIEKKPLYHFYPGKWIISAGSYGCNLKCSFCQNYSIAHDVPRTVQASPEELVGKAMLAEDSIGIAYTYNEPSIWYEYVLDTARLASQKGLKNVLVTNGYISGKPLKELLPFIDAMNIDVKAFGEEYYLDICRGRLKPVVETVERAIEHCHIEITTLVVGGLNDNSEELEQMGEWLGHLDKNIPLHLSRYYPAYKMNRPATSIEALLKTRELMKKYLNHVYIGNVNGMDNSTYCPHCGKKLIDRNGYRVKIMLNKEECVNCGRKINIKLTP